MSVDASRISGIDRVRFLPTSALAPGMVLAAQVREVTFHRLFSLPAGTVLTEAVIEQMTRKGVECVPIKVRDASPILPEQVRAIDQDMDVLFRGQDMRRADVTALYDAVLTFRLMGV